MAEATADTEQLVRTYVDAINERAYSTLQDLVSDSFIMYDPAAPGGEVHGPDGLEAFIREVAAGFPDFRVEILDVLATNDLVMYEGKVTMTHEGEFDGINPTGREAEFREMTKYRVEDGSIREHRAYFDQQGIYEQLGITED